MATAQERVVLISGGAGGAGLAMVQVFAEQGDRVFVIDRAASGHRVAELGLSQVSFIAADVFDETQVEATIAQVLNATERVDVLVNVVGGYAAGQPIHELATATWENMLELNLRATFLLSKYAARPMIARRWGRIINFAARAGRTTDATAGGYAVAKAGVLALTEVQSKELLPHHITVNAILPSIIDTPANRASMPNAHFDRWPQPVEVARVIRFLASDDAVLISGAGIPVYGQA